MTSRRDLKRKKDAVLAEQRSRQERKPRSCYWVWPFGHVYVDEDSGTCSVCGHEREFYLPGGVW